MRCVASSAKCVPLVFVCNVCGFVWTCDVFVRCPGCDGADLVVVPLKDAEGCSRVWFEHHGLGDVFC